MGAAEGKFPLQRRGDPLSLPEELVNEELGGGNAQLLEERRLFYVAMTRARDELVFTSASDYGTSRARKVSRFVVEALDLPSPKPVSRKTAPLEALARHAPGARALAGSRAPDPRATSCCGSPTTRSTTTRPARSSTATCTCCACRC